MARQRRPAATMLPLLAAMLVSGLAACGVDDAEVQLCRSLIAAFEPDPGRVTIERVASHPNADTGVIIDYTLSVEPHERPGTMRGGSQAGERPVHWLSCRFESGRDGWFGRETRLVEVSSDRTGKLSGVDLQMLKIWLRVRRGRPEEGTPVSRMRPNRAPRPASPGPTASAWSAAAPAGR